MVLTVQGASQVPVYPCWVFSRIPQSFLGSSNVSLSLPAVYANPCSAAFRGLGTFYLQYVWFDSGVQNWNCFDQCCAQYKFQKYPDPLSWDSGPNIPSLSQLLLFLLFSLLLISFLSLSLFFTNEKNKTHVTDVSKLRSLSISSQQALWSSAVPERSPGLAVCTELNQSGS